MDKRIGQNILFLFIAVLALGPSNGYGQADTTKLNVFEDMSLKRPAECEDRFGLKNVRIAVRRPFIGICSYKRRNTKSRLHVPHGSV